MLLMMISALGVHAFYKLDDHAYPENSAEIFARMLETANKGRELVDTVTHISREATAGGS